MREGARERERARHIKVRVENQVFKFFLIPSQGEQGEVVGSVLREGGKQ